MKKILSVLALVALFFISGGLTAYKDAKAQSIPCDGSSECLSNWSRLCAGNNQLACQNAPRARRVYNGGYNGGDSGASAVMGAFGTIMSIAEQNSRAKRAQRKRQVAKPFAPKIVNQYSRVAASSNEYLKVLQVQLKSATSASEKKQIQDDIMLHKKIARQNSCAAKAAAAGNNTKLFACFR